MSSDALPVETPEMHTELPQAPMDLDQPAAGNPEEPATLDVQLMEAVNEKPAKKKRVRKAKVTLPTSDPNIEVELRSHQPGPKKQRVVVYKEDMPQDQLVIVEKSHKKGRPPSQKAIVQRITEGVQVQDSQISFPRPSPQIELTAKQIRHLELAQQFATVEAAAGRKLRQTTKGIVDKRCIMERTPKQIASAKALVERNLLRKLAKQQEQKAQTSDTVKTILGELSQAYEEKVQKVEPVQAPPPPPPPVQRAPIKTRDLFKN